MWYGAALKNQYVQFVPQQASSGPRMPAVEAVFREHGIALEMLPKNMTDALQVMDLVVNGPLKAVLRRRRSWALFAALQAHRLRV